MSSNPSRVLTNNSNRVRRVDLVLPSLFLCPVYLNQNFASLCPNSPNRSKKDVTGRGVGPAFPFFNPGGCPAPVASFATGRDFDLRELRMPSQVPRPVPAKNAGTRTGQPLDLRFYLERMGQPPNSRSFASLRMTTLFLMRRKKRCSDGDQLRATTESSLTAPRARSAASAACDAEVWSRPSSAGFRSCRQS